MIPTWFTPRDACTESKTILETLAARDVRKVFLQTCKSSALEDRKSTSCTRFPSPSANFPTSLRKSSSKRPRNGAIAASAIVKWSPTANPLGDIRSCISATASMNLSDASPRSDSDIFSDSEGGCSGTDSGDPYTRAGTCQLRSSDLSDTDKGNPERRATE